MTLKKFIMGCYQAWIEENIPYYETAGNCTLWARVMATAFPELMLVGGYVRAKKVPFFSVFAFNYHEYLITEDGDIVDPTAVQFDKLIGEGNWYYDRWEEHLIYLNED